MANGKHIQVILSAVDQNMARTFRQAEQDMQRLAKASSEMNATLKRVGLTIKATFSGFVGGAGVREIVNAADTYRLLEGRLKLVTGSSEELASVQKELYELSQRTRSAFSGNVETYSRLAQNTKDLGISQEQLLAITETLNKAFTISGATETERSATMIQLSQAFSSGVLRGEEFNSVAEQGSRVLQLLADYTGKTRGELRGMAEDGKLTSDVLVKAILKGARDVDSEFSKMGKTVSQAGTTLLNTFESIISGADKSAGVTASLAESITDLRDNAERNKEEIISLFTRFIEVSRQAADRYGKDVATLIGLLVSAKAAQIAFNVALNANPYVRAAVALGVLNEALKNYNLNLGSIPQSAADLSTPLQNMADVLSGKRDASTGHIYTEIEKYEQRLKKLQATLSELTGEQPWYMFEIFPDESVKKNRIEEVKNEIAEIQKKLSEIRPLSPYLTGDFGKSLSQMWIDSHDPAQKYNSLIGQVIQTEQLAADQLEKLRANYLKSAEAQKKYADILKQINIAEKAGQISASEASDARGAAKNEFERITGAAAAYQKALREQVKAEKEAQQAKTDRLAMLESQVALKEAALARQQAEGTISASDALRQQVALLQERQQILENHLATMPKGTAEEVTAYNAQATALERVNEKLALQGKLLLLTDKWKAVESGLKSVADKANTSGQQIKDAIEGAFSSLDNTVAGFVSGTKTSFGDMANSIIADMARIFSQQYISAPLASGFGSILSSIRLFHSGGIAGAEGGVRLGVNPAIFSSARRYHTGLLPGEFPAILKKGEGVFTQGQMAALGAAATNSGSVQVNIIESQGKGGQQSQRTENGVNIIDVFVDKVDAKLAQGLATGNNALSSAMGSVYGLTPVLGR